MESRLYKSIDDYNSDFPAEKKETLELLRKTIRKVAPDALEIISYNMPAFKGVVSYGAWKKHIGFYVGHTPIEAFKEELAGFKTSRGTIQFPYDKPLPLALIRNLVKFRLAEKMNTDKIRKQAGKSF